MNYAAKFSISTILLLGAAQAGFCCGDPERPELKGCHKEASTIVQRHAATPQADTLPEHPDLPPPARCTANAAKFLEGQPYTADLPERARQAAGAAEVRVLRQGDFITKDYMMERLNIIVDDEQRTVLRVRCG